MTATSNDGGGNITGVVACKCGCHVPCHITLPLHPSLSTLAAWGVSRQGKEAGNGPLYRSSVQVHLFNQTEQAAAVQVSRPVVKQSICSPQECRFAAYLGCSLSNVSGVWQA